MKTLEGKVAIVTGSGRGLGRAHAKALAAAGAAVVVNDPGVTVNGQGSEERPADKVVDEIRADGGRSVANHASVSDWAGAEGLIETAVAEFGKLDILVNNAGILRDRMSFNMTEDEWDAVIDVHLKGHFATSRFAASHWRTRAKQGEAVSGRIINTTSEAGLYGHMGQVNYGAAKAGIIGMTFVMTQELANMGVTVNAVSPRAVTRMTGSDPENPEQLAMTGLPEQVSPLVVYLASDAAAHITGQVFLNYAGNLKLLKGFPAVAEQHVDRAFTEETIAEAVEALFENASSRLEAFVP